MREDNRVPPRSDSLIQRTVLRDQIRELLTTRILNGDYAPGERLVETRIAAELGTSQGPVREALRELEVIGLVEHEPYRGASVRNQEPRELAEVFPVREALEVVAVRLASRNLANDPSPLHEAVETMRAAARSGDLRACVAGDVAFHTAIVAAAENASLLGAYNSLGIEGHVIALMTRLRLNLSDVAEAHGPLLGALEEGRMGAAVKELRAHLGDVARVAPVSPSRRRPARRSSAGPADA